MVDSDVRAWRADDDDGPERPLPPPPLPSELVSICWQRFQLRHPGWDVTRLILVVTALIATSAVAWMVVRGSDHSPERVAQDTGPAATVGTTPFATTTTTQPTSTVPDVVIVDVSGAVASPGLVRVAPSARVDGAIEAAGGAAPGADLNRVNRAALLVDGERIYVPRIGEKSVPESVNGGDGSAAPGASTGAPSSQSTGPVNLNTATEEQLDTLPGVGPSTAQAIIDYRSEHGRFTRVEDLLEVRGIGDAKFATLRSRVTV